MSMKQVLFWVSVTWACVCAVTAVYEFAVGRFAWGFVMVACVALTTVSARSVNPRGRLSGRRFR